MSDHQSWQRFLEIKEKSATPGHPEQKQAQQDHLNTLLAENADAQSAQDRQRQSVAGYRASGE